MKIFQINDCEWWIGETLDEVIREIGEPAMIDADARELTDAEIDRLLFYDEEILEGSVTDFRHWQCTECGATADGNCRWNGTAYEHHHGYPIGHVLMRNIHVRTFREELERMMGMGAAIKRPQFFATTER